MGFREAAFRETSGDDESADLLIAVRQAIEKEIKEHKDVELEMEDLTNELVATFEQEKNDPGAALNNQIASPRLKLAKEKERHCIVYTRTLHIGRPAGTAIQGPATRNRIGGIPENCRESASAHTHALIFVSALRQIELPKNNDKDLKRAITKNLQANEAEIRDCTALFEAHAHNFILLRQAMSYIQAKGGARI